MTNKEMDFSNISNDDLSTMLNDVKREIKWAERYNKPTKELDRKYKTIKTEILRRMGSQ